VVVAGGWRIHWDPWTEISNQQLCSSTTLPATSGCLCSLCVHAVLVIKIQLMVNVQRNNGISAMTVYLIVYVDRIPYHTKPSPLTHLPWQANDSAKLSSRDPPLPTTSSTEGPSSSTGHTVITAAGNTAHGGGNPDPVSLWYGTVAGGVNDPDMAPAPGQSGGTAAYRQSV
jgi:hypothetical protein